MRKIFSIFLLLCLFSSSAYAVEFDTSVDDTIRKTYKVEYDETLPALPSVVPTASQTIDVVQPKYNPTGKKYVLKRGTKINLISNTTITGWTPKGTIVSFSAKNGFNAKDGTIIPAGTIFKGKVTDSHPPQLTGNGGLIELSIDEIYFNGVKSFIGSKLALADDKKIFLGNIKGERTYWKNYSKAMTVGKKTFSATQTCASAMSVIPVVNLFAFVPIVAGASVYAGNLVVAPFISIFKKGKDIALPAGTEFQIKLTENSEIFG